MQDSQSRGSLAEELARATGRPLTIRRVALDSLHLDPSNARAHDERNLETIQGLSLIHI